MEPTAFLRLGVPEETARNVGAAKGLDGLAVSEGEHAFVRRRDLDGDVERLGKRERNHVFCRSGVRASQGFFAVE